MEKFGTRTFDVLDHYPDSLLEMLVLVQVPLLHFLFHAVTDTAFDSHGVIRLPFVL